MVPELLSSLKTLKFLISVAIFYPLMGNRSPSAGTIMEDFFFSKYITRFNIILYRVLVETTNVRSDIILTR